MLFRSKYRPEFDEIKVLMAYLYDPLTWNEIGKNYRGVGRTIKLNSGRFIMTNLDFKNGHKCFSWTKT